MPFSQPILAFLLLLAYFGLHSILAAEGPKAWFASNIGSGFRYYRLGYNVVASILLLLLLQWMNAWPETVLFHTNIWTKTFAAILWMLGAWLSIGALMHYNLWDFTGFQAFQKKEAPFDLNDLNTKGLNALVRHPLYLGLILFLTGSLLFSPKLSSVVFLMSVVVYLPFGIYFEEQKLIRQFGQAYQDYSSRVKCLIPGIW